MNDNAPFSRSVLLLGADGMAALQRLRVVLFGVGGVGSWCAEALVRSGLTHLTLVDDDLVAASNINRQGMATPATLGQPKVEAMRTKLLSINPSADIVALQQRFTSSTSGTFKLSSYDIVIDAIDSLADKASLILCATAEADGPLLLSSMGAALRLDSTQVRVSDFWEVHGCPLARALRHLFRQHGTCPVRPFRAVFSPEPPHPAIKGHPNGSIMPVTAAFGLALASEVLCRCAAARTLES